MKQLKCEMCGSNDLIKKDGVFVCQYCGCQYTVEEAKKLMIEGVVNVTGTIRIDESRKTENYIVLAEAAYNANKLSEAESYCMRVLEIDRHNCDAWLVKARITSQQRTLDNLWIDECVNYYEKALESAPKERINEIKTVIEKELTFVFSSAISLLRNIFDADKNVKTAIAIYDCSLRIEKYADELSSKYGIHCYLDKQISTIMTNYFKKRKALKLIKQLSLIFLIISVIAIFTGEIFDHQVGVLLLIGCVMLCICIPILIISNIGYRVIDKTLVKKISLN